MRLIVPSLLLCAVGIPAVEAGLERVVRTQEGVQRGVASQAELAASKAGLIADDLRFNRLGDDEQADRIAQVGSELASLVRSPQAELKTMAYVVERLSRVRRGDTAELGNAAGAQGELVGRLDRLAKNAQGRIAAANGLDDLRAAIDTQRRLLEETAKLADQTLGKEKSELSTAEKSDLEKQARQQQSLEKSLEEAVKSLREQAKAAENANDKKNLEAAANELDKGQIAKETDKATDALKENHLAEAQEAQQKVLDKLEEAERTAAGDMRDPLAALDKRMQDLAQAQREEQRLLEETRAKKDLSKEEADRLAAKQQDIARDLKELAQQNKQDQNKQNQKQQNDKKQPNEPSNQQEDRLEQAQQQAEQAQQSLKQQDKANAEKRMEQALKDMAAAQKQMQQEMERRQAEQDAQRQDSAEQQLAQLEKDSQEMQQAQEQQQKLLDQLKSQQQLSKPQSKQMSAKQKEISQKMQQLKQEQPRQESQQAEQALDQQNKEQAQQEMQQTMEAMKQAQQQMQQQMQQARQKMQQSDPQKALEQKLAQLEKDAKSMQQAQEQQQEMLDKLESQQQMSKEQAQEMSAKEQDLAKQMQQMKQDAAQQKAQQAKQSLDQQNKQQAEQNMKQALQEMQQAQQQMQQQMQQTKQKMKASKASKPGQTKEPQAQVLGEEPGSIEAGERKGVHRKGWDVGLEPQDREVLSQVKADAFPSRYEQALVQYYRALAGEADK